ncbi:carboxypeptidase-like regulatory domain-containing protein [Capnocytophaga cynodegmi]|uniref:carboxypeptidase-like regulatory domain-containing protein n=1 Tax=Capnocytophaga cynodegmi TaxID=28189 RepID=UPI00385E371F
MRLKKFYLVLLLFGALQLSFAQEKVVTGTVKDNLGHELLGVTVIVKGEQVGTQTDFDGKYSLKVAQGKVLVFSFIGMKNKEITVGNSSKIDVILEEDVQNLEEVVIMGYNTRKKDVTSANITTVTGESLGKLTPSTSVDNMLQGKASGVDVTALNGKNQVRRLPLKLEEQYL